MSTFKNFVQCRVTSPITAVADSIGLYAAVPPYTLPSEEGGLLVLTDSPTKPSKLEVISYTSRSALGLYGVTRGLEGTTAQEWTGPVYCYQSLLAGEFKSILDSKVDKVNGKQLTDENYTQDEKTKLAGLDAAMETKASKTELTTGLGLKVDIELGKGLSDTNFTQAEKEKLADIASEATKNRADSENADKLHTHPAEQVSGLGTAATLDLLDIGTTPESARMAIGVNSDPLNTTIQRTGDLITSLDMDGRTTIVTYNADETINTMVKQLGTKTRTETYSYTDGLLTSITATEV